MEGIGRSHSPETCFSTWATIGETLSNTLLSEPDALYIHSTTQVMRKDFLLFTLKKNVAGDGTRGIIEVDFTQKLAANRWEGH